MKILLILTVLVTSTYADTRYIIHSSEGAMVRSTNPCGEDVRDALEAVITGIPSIVVSKTSMRYVSKTKNIAADSFNAGEPVVGFWTTGSKHLVITLRHGGHGDHGPKVLDINVVRRIGDKACYEKWQGIVLPTPIKETLRGR